MTTSTAPLPAFALGTFSMAGCAPFPGLLLDGQVIAVAALGTLCGELGHPLPPAVSTLELLDRWAEVLPALHAAAAALAQPQSAEARAVLARRAPLQALRVHAPVQPRQVLCCGANYFKHVVDLIVDQPPTANPGLDGLSREERRVKAQEMMERRQREGVPYFFSKPVSAVTGPFDPIILPPHAKKPDWELELAVVIGQPGLFVEQADAMKHVAGYTIANDVSNRDHIYRNDDMKALGSDWIMSKSQPSYLPLGPFIVPASEVAEPQNLQIQLQLNGRMMQDENTSDMIFDISRQIAYISSMVQLLPGDVICTGSPAGNGTHYTRFLQPGDVVDAHISGLGAQRNPVQARTHLAG
jgi:2,4-diketo-3-deoxy-L-fuconate hydrolase